jgi:RNA polymerase sigma-70 factor (ECF subfamily)
VATDLSLANRTTTQLLDALRDHGNTPAWSQIDARYRPVVAGLACRLGLSGSDADEVAQQTLVEFVRSFKAGRYDRSKGRLSSWILGIAHHTVLAMMRARRDFDSNTVIERMPDEPSLRSLWTEERDRAVLSRALGALRSDTGIDERTLTAFELTGLRGVPAAVAAEECGMSVDQVYVARSRLTKRLRELVESMTAAFEEDG